MIKLFDEDVKTSDRKSTKGNQLKFVFMVHDMVIISAVNT